MRPSRQRVAWVARLWVAAVGGAGDLCSVEGYNIWPKRCVAVVHLLSVVACDGLGHITAVHRHDQVVFGASTPGTVGRATICSACSNAGGNSLPRLSARRNIPAHAVELKKNRCWIEPVSSTCDNEHTAAALGHSKILGIKDSPRDCSLWSKHTTSVRPSSPWRFEFAAFAGKACQKAAEGVVL